MRTERFLTEDQEIRDLLIEELFQEEKERRERLGIDSNGYCMCGNCERCLGFGGGI